MDSVVMCKRAFKRMSYHGQQDACFGDDSMENTVWDSYIHGESVISEDILLGEYNDW